MISAYPKIFAIGTSYIRDIFKGEVEITEKVDGSHFCFGKIDSVLQMRSKGQDVYAPIADNMFREAVNYVTSIESKLQEGNVYYCEYLRNPKHNKLAYDRIPLNHLYLFGVSDKTQTYFINDIDRLVNIAGWIGIEPPKLLFSGAVLDSAFLLELLDQTSVLGGPQIEGVVVKNYGIPFLLGGQPIPVMAGKFVSEKYKEIKRVPQQGKDSSIELFLDGFRIEQRWEKAVQHLKDNGVLEDSPRDIGLLIKEIQRDVTEEGEDYAKEWLWKHFQGSITRRAISGFPEWYKELLLQNVLGDNHDTITT